MRYRPSQKVGGPAKMFFGPRMAKKAWKVSTDACVLPNKRKESTAMENFHGCGIFMILKQAVFIEWLKSPSLQIDK